MTKKNKFLFGFLLLFFSVACSFLLGYSFQNQTRNDQAILSTDEVPTQSPSQELSQEQRQLQLNSFYQEDFKRQFLEEYLPLHPDLQQELSEREITAVHLYTLNSGENEFLIETQLKQPSSVSPSEYIDHTIDIYLASGTQWQVIEKDLNSSCTVENVEEFTVQLEPRQGMISTDNVGRKVNRRLIYETNCGYNFSVGLVDLEKQQKLPIRGTSLPSWLSQNIQANGSINGKIGELVGYGSNIIFEARVYCKGCQYPNRVVISGLTGQIINWFDYDKYAGQQSNYFPGN